MERRSFLKGLIASTVAMVASFKAHRSDAAIVTNEIQYVTFETSFSPSTPPTQTTIEAFIAYMDNAINYFQTAELVEDDGSRTKLEPEFSRLTKITFSGEGEFHPSDLQINTKALFERKGYMVNRARDFYVKQGTVHLYPAPGEVLSVEAATELVALREDLYRRINHARFEIPMKRKV